jgi:hypothetical protein
VTATFWLLLVVSGQAAAAPARMPEDAALATKIEKLLHTVLTTDNDAEDAAAKAEMKTLFERRGLPTIAEVGNEAAYEFVVLAFYQQPADFRARVLVEARQAAQQHEIPADALMFLEARARRERATELSRKTPPANPDLRDDILRMAEADQRVRQRKDFDAAKMEETDKQNEAPLRNIIDKYGVPTISMVGPKAANAFVLMVQHQSAEFRQRVLPGLKANVDAGEADPEAYALVYDRLQRNMGRKQFYGTQLECIANGTLEEAPLEDPAGVDERRAELGMLRLALYERVVRVVTPNVCQAGARP